MLVQGGEISNPSGPGDTPQQAVWALSLGPTPQWSKLSPAVSSGFFRFARSRSSAAFVPTPSPEFFTYGDFGVYSLALVPPMIWFNPGGPPYGVEIATTSVYDSRQSQVIVFGGVDYNYSNRCWAESRPPLPSDELTCPGPLSWAPGQRVSRVYRVRNHQIFGQYADWRLESARDWPGFPSTGSLWIEAGAESSIAASIDIPDSVAPGANVLTMKVILRSVPAFSQCVDTLADEATATEVSLASASATTDKVQLTWYAADQPGLLATVERSTDGSIWTDLGVIHSDGSGRLTFEDTAIRPGERLGYRLLVVRGGISQFDAETWVNVPLAPRLHVDGFRPNPAGVAASVSFTLGSSTPALLEAFDLEGRRVWSSEVGSLGAGNHVVRFTWAVGLPAGVYVLRLRQDQLTETARSVVIR